MQEKFMKIALKEAEKAYKKEEIPVGAIIVKNGKIIARGHNTKETNQDGTMHAEMIAIKKASKKLKNWRLIDCEMYITLEPCTMCAGAIINSRIKKIYIGTEDKKTGAVGSVLNLFEDYTFNHKVEYEKYILKEDCEKILKDFFKELRLKKRRKKMIISKGDEIKTLKRCLIIISVILVIFVIAIIMFKYWVEGENKETLPFNIEKIKVVSTAKGIKSTEKTDFLWSGEIIQINDIYIQINKNTEKDCTIKNINIENLRIVKKIQTLEQYTTKIHKIEEENTEYLNEKLEKIQYKVAESTNLESLTVSKQGGTIGFRFLTRNLGEYKSNETEISYDGKLLKNSNIDLEDLKSNINFDIIIETDLGVKYKTNVTLTVPVGNITEEGTSVYELENIQDLVIKRI